MDRIGPSILGYMFRNAIVVRSQRRGWASARDVRSSRSSRKIDNAAFPGNEHRKIPHMGWNRVSSRIAQDPILAGVSQNPYVYFVHSYYVVPDDQSVTWLNCNYGQEFCAAVRVRNMMATQFHPEKSQTEGLQMLKNFFDIYACTCPTKSIEIAIRN